MEVEVLQWFVGPGDRVSQFDKLCEVQSDKVLYIACVGSLVYLILGGERGNEPSELNTCE